MLMKGDANAFVDNFTSREEDVDILVDKAIRITDKLIGKL